MSLTSPVLQLRTVCLSRLFTVLSLDFLSVEIGIIIACLTIRMFMHLKTNKKPLYRIAVLMGPEHAWYFPKYREIDNPAVTWALFIIQSIYKSFRLLSHPYLSIS